MRKPSYNINTIKYFDYKDLELLKLFVNPYGQMQTKRRNGLTAKQQRALSQAIKRARFMGLLPYIVS